MPFYLYKWQEKGVEECFDKLKQAKLAGYNTIYNLWIKKSKPIDKDRKIC